MDIAEKTLQLKKDFDDVYNKGYSQSESDFWDDIQRNGKRTTVDYMFKYWNKEYIRPKYFIKANSTARILCMFQHCTKVKIIEKKYFDLSAYTPATNSSDGGSIYCIFQNCANVEIIEDIGIQGGGYASTYRDCPKLHTIEKMRCVVKGTYNAPFTNCTSLVNLTIEGEIGKAFDIHYSPLSTASIVSIIEHLSDTQGATLTLNTDAVNNMVFPYTSPYTNTTYNSWDELIATKTNWTISKASA